jgi:hypothetical protein
MTKKQFKEYIKEIIISEITMVGAKTEPGEAAEIAKTERTGIDTVKAAIAQAKKTSTAVGVAEMSLNEMAKIAGDLDAAIRKVIEDNPDLEGLPLKKAIKGSEKVKDALDTDELYDNQLNKFIALVRGQRELGKKGRKPSEKADEPKKEEPKAKKEAPKKETPKKETPKKEAPKKEKKAKDEDEEEVEDNWNKSGEDDGMEDEKSIDKKAQAAAKKGGSNLTKLNRAISQVKELEKEMKEIANDYKKAEGKEKENLLNKLKEKTKEKKELEKLQDELAADVV